MTLFGQKNAPWASSSTRHPLRWKIGAFLFALAGISTLVVAVRFVARPASASGPSSNRVLNYQIRLTDPSGIPTADGTKNIKISFYDAVTGGTMLHTDCGTTVTPVGRKVIFTGGVGSVLIGDTAADASHNCADGSAPNALPATLFNNVGLFLGLTVEADAEMTPRKRIVATGYSLNADRLDDLETSSVGGAVAFVPVTDSSGNLTLTKDLTVDGSTLFVDSTNDRVGIGTAAPGSTLYVGGNTVVMGDRLVDADGSATTAAGIAAAIAEGATLVSAAGQNLCTSSLTEPIHLRIDANANCADTGADTILLGAGTGTVAVTSAWSFSDTVTLNGVYDNGEDIYIDNAPALRYATGNAGIGTFSPGERLEVVGNIISKGTAWTSRTSAADVEWTSVAYGNGLFVAVARTGSGNRLMTSPDGINWTVRPGFPDSYWNSITYGNGLFVAVNETGSGNRVATSPDGITWTLRTSAADNNWSSVTYGNGLFVAVSYTGTGNRVMTSPDGITWTLRTSAADNNWDAVTYGNGLFVAVSYTGTGNRVMTSPDGITWTLRTSAADNFWASVTYGNGLFVATAITGVGNRVMTSPDGITWTLRTSPADKNWVSVTYGNGLFVAVAFSALGNSAMTSPDGITWTLRSTASNNSWFGVTYGNGLFVAVAISGTGNRVMTSGKTEVNVLSANNIYQGGMNIFGNVGIGTATPITQLHVPGRVPSAAAGSVATGDGPISVAVKGRYAYVLNTLAATLQVFDVSNASAPVAIGSVATGADPVGVVVEGRYAYVTNFTAGTLQIFDVSNPAAPVSVGTVATGAGPSYLSVQGRYAYTANYTANTLQIFDVSNPAAPVSVGSVATGTNPQFVVVQGRYAYVTNNGSNTLQIFDVSSPAAPVSVGSVATGTQPSGVYVQGRYAYVVNYGSNSLQIFSVANPAAPVSVGTVATGTNPYSVFVQGRYAYVNNYIGNTLQAIDVSNPVAPVSVGSVATGNSPYGIFVQGRYAYIVNLASDSLQVFDLGGAYIQQVEAGGLESGTLTVRNGLQAMDAVLSGGLSVGDSVQVSGPLSVSGASAFIGNVGIGTATPAGKLDIQTGTITTDTAFGLNVAGSLDGSASGGLTLKPVKFEFSTSGAGTNRPEGMRVTLNAGYTGSGFTKSLFVQNVTASTDPFNSGTFSGNMGALITSTGAGVDNIGVYSQVSGATSRNLGYYSRVSTATAGSNIGYFGIAANATTNNIGGYFALTGTSAGSLNTSAALIADNGTTVSPIFLARDNGTAVLTVADGGTTTLAGHFLPDADDTFDLGSDVRRWRDLFTGPGTIHVGTSTSDEGTISYNTSTNSLQIDTTAGGTVEIAGGSGSSGCTVDTSGNFTCSGTVAGAGGGPGWTDDGTVVRLTTVTDNVGIGTLSPTARLAVQGVNSVAVLGSDAISNGAFGADLSGWTAGANWSWSDDDSFCPTAGVNGCAYHTVGDNNLSQTLTGIVAGTAYQIIYSVRTLTSGKVHPVLGGASNGALYVGDTVGTITNFQVVLAPFSSGSVDLVFDPDATWSGSIDLVSVKPITPSSSVIDVNNSDGTRNIEIRAGGPAKDNTLIGRNAGWSATTGFNNTALGVDSLFSTTSGGGNVAVGYFSMYSNTTGGSNVAVGTSSLSKNTSGLRNTALGDSALLDNRSGSDNASTGRWSMLFNASGSQNAAHGARALISNTTGSDNAAFGYQAGNSNVNGSFNTFIGSNANASTGSLSIASAFGYNATVGCSNCMVLGGTGANAVNVGIGLASPITRLDLVGNLRSTGRATAVLTGTIDPIASTTVTGVGTLFTTQLVVGDRITVTGQTRTVTAIATDTSLTVDTAFSDNANDTTPDVLYALSTMRNSSNAVKMAVNDLGSVGIGTAAPAALFHVAGESVLFTGTFGTGVAPVSGAGERMLWYPGKAAIRAGRVTASQWNDANIGNHSAAFNLDTTASSHASFATGNGSTASGDVSTAMGASSVASGIRAVAIGESATASGTQSMALGTFVTAGSSSNTFVLGRGVDSSNRLVNTIRGSLMYGHNDTTPTLYVRGGEPYDPQGTVSNSAGGTAVTGSITFFTNDIVPGDRITIGGETRIVSVVTNDSNLTVSTPFTSAHSGSTFTVSPALLKLQDSSAAGQFVVDAAGNVGVGNVTPASFKLQVAGDAGPNADNTFDLGSASLRWKTLHTGPGSVVVHNDATNTNKITLGYTGSTATLTSTSGTPFEIRSGTTPAISVSGAGAVTFNGNLSSSQPLTIAAVGHAQGGSTRAIWRLDESSGTATAADVTGTYPLATITGTPGVTTGQFGNARTFGGAADVRGAADAGSVTQFKTGAWTLGMWFIANNTSAGNMFALMDAGLNAPFHVKIAAGGGVCAGSTDQGNNCAGSITPGVMTFLTVVHTGAGAGFDVYLNGALAGHITVNDSALTPASPLFVIGNGPHQFFSGTIDDVFIENTAMSSGAISAEYAAATQAMLTVTGKTVLNGNVGIGTATPTAFKLQVAGDVGPSVDNLYDLGSSALRWKTLHVGPGSVVVHNDTTNTNKLTLGFTSSTAQLSTNAGIALEVKSGTATALRIDSSGTASLNSAFNILRPATFSANGHLQAAETRGLWRLDESSGTATAADVTGTYPLATIGGTPGVTAGKFGNARTFNGSSYVRGAADAASVTQIKTGAWSLGMWFISTNSATGLGKNLFALMDASNNAPFHVKVAFNSIYAGSTDQGNSNAGGTITDGLWYHMVLTHAAGGSGFDVYLNGAFIGHINVNNSALTPASPLFVIGSGPHDEFEGTIDDVFLENRVMTGAEILAEFNLASNTTPLTVNGTSSFNGNVGIGMAPPLTRLDLSGNLRTTGKATSVLTGSIDPAASTTVTGVGTLFTTQLVVGDRITVTGETRTVTAIASDTSLTVDTAFSNNANDTSPDVLYALFTARDSGNATKLIINDLGNFYGGPVSSTFTSQSQDYIAGTKNAFTDLNGSKVANVLALAQSNTTSDGTVGFQAYAESLNGAATTKSFITALSADTYHDGAGTVTDLDSMGVFAAIRGGGTATTMRSLRIWPPESNGTVANYYGLMIEDPTAMTVTNDTYNIYSQGNALNHFGPDTTAFVADAQSYIDAGRSAFTSLNSASSGRGAALVAVNQDNSTSDMFGLYAYGESAHTSGTRNNITAVAGDAQHSTAGNVGTLYGMAGWVSLIGSGTVGEAASIYAHANQHTGGGTITTNAGLMINDQTGIGATNYQILSKTAAGTRFAVRSDGNVGIGTDTPGTRLYVTQSSATVASFNRTTDDGTIISLLQDGSEEGSISVSGTTISYNAFTGSHYAWTDVPIAQGMLVSYTGENRRLHGDEDSEILYGITPSATRNDPAVVGVYLALKEPSQPANDENPHLVMAVGNGDVWVVDDGADIEPGDYLMSSDTPGHAMKDAGTEPVSHLIARAAEPVQWGTVTETVGGKKHKKISVTFVNFTRYSQAQTAELTVAETLDYKGYGIENVAFLRGLNGNWSIDEAGLLISKAIMTEKVTTQNLTIKNEGDSVTAGTGAIREGAIGELVINPLVNERSIIVVTFEGDTGARWWISEKENGKFMINLSSPALAETKFSYWIVGLEGGLPPAEPPTVPPAAPPEEEPPEAESELPQPALEPEMPQE